MLSTNSNLDPDSIQKFHINLLTISANIQTNKQTNDLTGPDYLITHRVGYKMTPTHVHTSTVKIKYLCPHENAKYVVKHCQQHIKATYFSYAALTQG